MIGLFIVVFMVIGTSTNSNFIFNPEDSYLLGLNDTLPYCSEVQQESVLTQHSPDRLSGFTLSGKYFCPGKLFEYGERNSFANFVITYQEIRAKQVAQLLKGEHLALKNNLAIEVITKSNDDIPLKKTVTATFINQLTEVLGPNQIRNEVVDADYTPKLKIEIRRLYDQKDYLDIKFYFLDELGKIKWRQL